MVLLILFWIIWLLWVLGFFFPLTPGWQRGHSVIGAILIGILGLKVFGNPLTH